MRITDPVLVPDVSDWCDHINPKEFEDNGCTSVIVGIYWMLDKNNKWVMNPISRKQCIAVATNSSMVLQAYFWDDIILSPVQQADWLVDTITMEGLPIKWIWADQEQWWTNWTTWWRKDAYIPRGKPENISFHNEAFMKELYRLFPASGVYTNKNFVVSNASGMDLWLPKYHSWVAHYGHQPKERTKMTWAQLKAYWLPNYDIILSAGQPEEMVAGHQFTGDVCMLPGSYNKYAGMIPGYDGRLPLDVSAFRKEFIAAIRSGNSIPIPIPPPVTSPQVYKTCKVLYVRINIRAEASSTSAWMRYAVLDEVLEVTGKVENNYRELIDHTWVFSSYVSVPQ